MPESLSPLVNDLRRTCRHLTGLDSGAIEALADHSKEARFEKDQHLTTLVNPSPRFIFVLEGVAKLVSHSEEGHQRILHVFRPGDITGSRFLVKTRESNHSIVAMTEMRGLVLPRKALGPLAERWPEILFALTRCFTNRMNTLSDRLLLFTTADTTTRLCQVLMDFADENDVDENGMLGLSPPLTHSLMAEIAGASRPHISEIMGRLKQQGMLIQCAYGELRIDPERIQDAFLTGWADERRQAS